jgi:hypothetical protein
MHARAMIGQVKPEKLSEADSAIRTYQNSIVQVSWTITWSASKRANNPNTYYPNNFFYS